MSAVAVIDFGKTNVKVALVDAQAGREIGVRRIANVVLPGPPFPHFDTAGHWDFILASLRQLAQAHRIDAISITAHASAAALIDAEGELVLPILDYEHDGPDTLAAAYDALRPPFEETGSPRLPAGLNLGAQLHWLFATFPEAHGARAILTYSQYWAFRLSGVRAAEATYLGCHTDLWSPFAAGYSSLVGRMGWSDLFPPLRRAGDRLGPVTAEVARATGLDPATPVLCGIHDSNASLYPHLVARKAPFAVVSTGTWVICMAVGGAAPSLDPGRDMLVNVDATGRPVPSARFMGGREYEIVRSGDASVPTPDDRSRALGHSTMLLPSVEPATGPFQGRTSHWTVEPRTAGERMLALSWYLALMTATCLDMIGAQGPVAVEGPFGRNRDYLAMLATATGRSVEAGDGNHTGTSAGAALLAGGSPALAVQVTPPDPSLAAYAAAWRRLTAA